jgi:hypothetical protein
VKFDYPGVVWPVNHDRSLFFKSHLPFIFVQHFNFIYFFNFERTAGNWGQQERPCKVPKKSHKQFFKIL